jgi:hypothetical protein
MTLNAANTQIVVRVPILDRKTKIVNELKLDEGLGSTQPPKFYSALLGDRSKLLDGHFVECRDCDLRLLHFLYPF